MSKFDQYRKPESNVFKNIAELWQRAMIIDTRMNAYDRNDCDSWFAFNDQNSTELEDYCDTNFTIALFDESNKYGNRYIDAYIQKFQEKYSEVQQKATAYRGQGQDNVTDTLNKIIIPLKAEHQQLMQDIKLAVLWSPEVESLAYRAEMLRDILYCNVLDEIATPNLKTKVTAVTGTHFYCTRSSANTAKVQLYAKNLRDSLDKINLRDVDGHPQDNSIIAKSFIENLWMHMNMVREKGGFTKETNGEYEAIQIQYPEAVTEYYESLMDFNKQLVAQIFSEYLNDIDVEAPKELDNPVVASINGTEMVTSTYDDNDTDSEPENNL